jgi:recombination protein RecA
MISRMIFTWLSEKTCDTRGGQILSQTPRHQTLSSSCIKHTTTKNTTIMLANRSRRGLGLLKQQYRGFVARVANSDDSTTFMEDAGKSAASSEARAKALEQALKEINGRFGKNSVMKLGANTFGEVVSTPSGALTLDLALGGGYPKGRVIEIYGPESAGKTTLALHALAEVQKSGGNVALIDAEHAFDPVFAKHLGVDIDSLYLCQPDSGEMALEVADQLIRSSAMDMIAVDSVAALVPRAEIEGEIGQLQVGAQARLMSAALRKIAGNASRHNCSIIFLNQLRQKVGVIYGNPEVTSGGQALKYYSSVRIEVRIKERISAGSDGQIGIRVKSKITKNKVAPPYKLAEFDILFGSGISSNGCLLDAAEAVGVVQRRGSYYFYGDERLGQGREKTLETFKTNESLRDTIDAQTRQELIGTDVNDMYDVPVPSVSAEGEDVERVVVEK